MVDRALHGSGELDLLRRELASVRALKPSLSPLVQMLEQAAAGREGPRAKRELARSLGWAREPGQLRFVWTERARRGRSERLVLHLHVDCDRDPFFAVRVSQAGTEGLTRLSSRGVETNALGVSPLERLSDWPGWARSVRRRVKSVQWERTLGSSVPRSAAAREALERWLSG